MSSLNYIIRDGTTDDIQPCLSIDHSVRTERVWQLTLYNEPGIYRYTFQQERLPRDVEVRHPKSASRLHLALTSESCFLIAEERLTDDHPRATLEQEPLSIPDPDDDLTDTNDTPLLLGYLSMQIEPVHGIARIQDIVVDTPFRRSRIGTRLLTIARRWASEHHMRRLLVEVKTQNYPAIQFCQQNGLEFCGFNEQYFESSDIAIFFGQAIG